MANQDMQKIVSHIDETQNWLNKAREDYLEENAIRGDMNLNLAQAEIQYTRELTREESVDHGMKHLQSVSGSANSSRLIWSAAAAILMVLAVLPIGFKMLFDVQPEVAAPNVVVERDNEVLAQTETQVMPQTELPATIDDDLSIVAVSTKEVSKTDVVRIAEKSAAIEEQPLVVEEVKQYEKMKAATIEKPIEPTPLVTFDENELLNAAKKSLQYGEQ